MPRIQDIPFRNIPHQSALFLSYLDLSAAALRFYRHAPTIESLERAAQGSLANVSFPRREMASILRRQNENYGGYPEILQRIEELEQPDCLAVLTGQQVGLFSGPLYTVYKALTAVHICKELRKRGMRAVPVFWMDTEDHDLAEVTRRTILDSRSSVETIDYGKSLFDEAEAARHPVGSLQFPSGIQQAVSDYLSHLPESAWKLQVQSRLESTYKAGSTFAVSFAQLMSQILRGSGLIFYDPQDAEAKRLTAHIFKKALQDTNAFHAALVQRSRELETAGFYALICRALKVCAGVCKISILSLKSSVKWRSFQ